MMRNHIGTSTFCREGNKSGTGPWCMFCHTSKVVSQKPILSPPPPHPHLIAYPFVAACCCCVPCAMNAWYRYAAQHSIVAKVRIASQQILLQAYVAEWPPKQAKCLWFYQGGTYYGLGCYVRLLRIKALQPTCTANAAAVFIILSLRNMYKPN